VRRGTIVALDAGKISAGRLPSECTVATARKAARYGLDTDCRAWVAGSELESLNERELTAESLGCEQVASMRYLDVKRSPTGSNLARLPVVDTFRTLVWTATLPIPQMFAQLNGLAGLL
jgi:hypothetical protein